MNIEFLNQLKPGSKVERTKIGEMNKFSLQWKCHKETPCVAILSNQKCHFFSSSKSEEGRTGPALKGLVPMEEGRWQGKGTGA
jgi:hypothetical protein